jgi:pilus assembly protein CpaF
MLHRGNAQVPSSCPLAVERQTDTFKANISCDDVPKSAPRFGPDRIIVSEVHEIEAMTRPDSFSRR